MDFLTANWGSLASVVGLVATIFIAWSARSAARSASQAATAARNDIARYLQTVDLTRAIGLIQRVKLLHEVRQWEVARDQYQTLREMLSYILARCPGSQTERHRKLRVAITQVRLVEDFVGARVNQGIDDTERARLNRALNEIQSGLEELAADIGFGESPEEEK